MISPLDIEHALDRKAFACFKGEYDLNIVGVRTDDDRSNAFNDWLTVMYWHGNDWLSYSFPATTDPGSYYRKNPANKSGTAIVKPGQYRGLWKIGSHRGKYSALVQVAPITLYRDSDRDDTLNAGREETGIFGINLHRASADRTSESVDRWSAGCQVVADPTHFDFIMAMCRRQIMVHPTYETFTYTLLEEGDL